ncbi:MAG: MYXO-CTERM domain-containing protein [Polyangiales bacterium]|jgi:MYXO-CTERM domain-containing protein
MTSNPRWFANAVSPKTPPSETRRASDGTPFLVKPRAFVIATTGAARTPPSEHLFGPAACGRRFASHTNSMKHLLVLLSACLLLGTANQSYAFDGGPCDPADPSCPTNPIHDAGPDTGPAIDAGPVINDAGPPAPDAGVPMGDAGPVGIDSGASTPPADSGGCSVDGNGSSSAPGWLAISLLAFGMIRRRR